MDTVKPWDNITEEFEIIPPREVLKRVIHSGSGPFLIPDQIATLMIEVYSEDGSNLATSRSMEFECRDLSTETSGFGIARLLQSMQVGEAAWAFFTQRYNDFKDTPWGNLWVRIEVLSVREVRTPLSELPYISEDQISEGIVKRVVSAGFGNLMPANARVNIVYSVKSEAGVEIEERTNKVMNVFRHSDGYFHKPIVLTLRTMKEGEEVLIRAYPGYHSIDSHRDERVWFTLFLGNIEVIEEFIEPRKETYLREEILREDGSVIKRVIQEGEDDIFPHDAIVWLTIEGRLEDGYCFQRAKKHKIDLGLNDSRIYSESWYLALKSMRRKEIAWIYSAKSHHLYEHNEPVWFKFVVEEYKVLSSERPINSMTFAERLESAGVCVQDGNRMFGSGKYGESLKAYNKAITLINFKKDELNSAEESFKNDVKNLRIRCWLNSAQALLNMHSIVLKPEDKIKKANEAITKCDEVLKLHPENEKALFRKACGFMLKQEFEKSFPILAKCISLRPTDKTIREKYNECREGIRQSEKVQRVKYGKMFAKLGELDKEEMMRKIEEEKKLMRDLNRESHRTSTRTSKINSQVVTPHPQDMQLDQDQIISKLINSGLVTGVQDDLDGYLLFDDD
jgi:tetratricopeptide (TPR) repeat protein